MAARPLAISDSILLRTKNNFYLREDLSMSNDDLQKEIARLRAENEALKKPVRGQISMKVSEKGGLSLYGMGRFPVTLYKEQWLKLLSVADDIRKFIQENEDKLKTKE